MNRTKARGVGTSGIIARLSGILCLAIGAMSCASDETVNSVEPAVELTEISSSKGSRWDDKLRVNPDSVTTKAGETVQLTAARPWRLKSTGAPAEVDANWFVLGPKLVEIEGSTRSRSTVKIRALRSGKAKIIAVYDGSVAVTRISVEKGDGDAQPDGDAGQGQPAVAAALSGPAPVLLVGDTVPVTVRPNLIDEDGVVIPTALSEWSVDFDPTHLAFLSDTLLTALAPTPPGSPTPVVLTHRATDFVAEIDLVILSDEDPVEGPSDPGDPVEGPTEPGYGSHNEPSGLRLIGAFDGSVKESNGHAFGIGSFNSWFSSNPANIAVVEDPSNPTGSGKALRFTWRGSDYRGAGIATANTFAGGPYRELYIRLRVFMENGGWNFGHKFFYVGRHTDARPAHNQPIQHYTDRPTERNPEKVRVVGNGAVILDSGNPKYGGSGAWPLQLGRWVTLEYHFVAESSPGAANGTARLWANGQLMTSNTGVAWNTPDQPTPGFNGMQWYANANSIPTTSHYRVGELYISGR